MNLRIAFLFLLNLAFVFVHGQQTSVPIVKRHVTNFTEEDFKENAQNWSICEDASGILYFGNYNSIISYNGETWLTIPITDQAGYITSLYYSAGDTIYWGGANNFGYLTVQDNGQWHSFSLKNKLDELDQYFSQVWRVLKYENKVVYFAPESIFIYNPSQDSLQPIYPLSSFHLAFTCNEKLFVRDRAFGLMEFDGEDFLEIDGGEVFLNEGVFGIYSISTDSMLVISQKLGCFIYLPEENRIQKYASADNDFIINQEIIGGIELSNDHIALNSASSGVIIIDKKGRLIEIVNLKSGTTDNDVKSIHQDLYGRVWLATNNGISRINFGSTISFYLDDKWSGLPGSAQIVEVLDDEVFVGTTSGLFKYNSQTFEFENVAGLLDNITSICAVSDGIFVGTSSTLFLYQNTSLRKLLDVDVRSIDFSVHKNKVYVTGNNGFYILDANSGYTGIVAHPELRIPVLKSLLVSSPQANDRLWLGTFNKGLILLDVYSDSIKMHQYADVDGETGKWVIPFFLNKRPVLGLQSGVWEPYIDDNSSTKIDEILFVPSENSSLETEVVTGSVDGIQNDYLIYNGIIASVNTNGKVDATPFLSLQVGKINDIAISENSKLWLASNKGVTLTDISQNSDIQIAPDIRIDKFMAYPDSLLFSGKPQTFNYELDFNLNSFRLFFSSSYSENDIKPLYSYRFENYDKEWSEWTNLPFVEYKKVKEGKYSFKIKAKNIYGVESAIKELQIRILPPWYRTLWAYGVYLFLSVMLVVLIIRVYTYRLKQKNRLLEATVAERTKEIVKQKDEIEIQRDLITEAHNEIQASIQYAKRIQTAVLPQKEFKHEIISDYFVLFKPRDVVSGDFYWARQTDEHLVITAADCSGHGVPGAFLSMLGVSLLNDIVGKENTVVAGEILDKLRNGIIHSLKQDKLHISANESVKDGMDMSLLSIHLENGTLSWAGANNPLFIISEQVPHFAEGSIYKIYELPNISLKMYEIKANKMPIAIADKMDDFVSHQINVNKGDKVFMFSDGYVDQFGGPKGKKLMVKNFRRLLLEYANLSMEQQKQELENFFNIWIEHSNDENPSGYAQLDDITIIGIEF